MPSMIGDDLKRYFPPAAIALMLLVQARPASGQG